MIRITLNEKYVIEHPIGGNDPLYSEPLVKYRNNLVTWGCKMDVAVVDGERLIVATMNPPLVNFDYVDFGTIMSREGGSVEGYKPYIAINEPDITLLVPAELPNSTYLGYTDDTDPDNIIIVPDRVKTWDEWFLNTGRNGEFGNYTKTIIEGVHYYNVNGPVQGKRSLTGDELCVVIYDGTCTIVDEVPLVEEIEP